MRLNLSCGLFFQSQISTCFQKELKIGITTHSYTSNQKVCFFADNGEVFGWGNSEYSQLHMATDEQQVNSPVKLNLGDVGKVLDVASGGSMCMVLNGKNCLRLIHEKWHKISLIPAVFDLLFLTLADSKC